jgi:WD40 repeat protein
LRTMLADENAASLSYQLVQLLRERYWEWWDYLGQVAAVDARFDTAAQLAAVCDGQATLWSVATGALRPLATGADQLLWAPNGQRLIAHSWRDGFTVVDMAQGPQNSSHDTPLAWAPDNEWIAVDSDIDATRYLWRFGQGERIKVAYGPGLVSWSPDGQHLAYAINEEELYLAQPDASAPQLVANGNRAAWSPDSRYLAVAANNFINSPVYVYDLQTAQLTRVITQVNGVLYDLAWTPAGTVPQLAVASHAPHAQPETAGEVRVVSPRGEVLRAWTLAGVPFDVEWSPRNGGLGWALAPLHGGGGEIWLAGTDGERAEPVTAARDSGYILSWRWSPAGDWLAFDNGGITVVSADQQTVLSLPNGCRTPTWRP